MATGMGAGSGIDASAPPTVEFTRIETDVYLPGGVSATDLSDYAQFWYTCCVDSEDSTDFQSTLEQRAEYLCSLSPTQLAAGVARGNADDILEMGIRCVH